MIEPLRKIKYRNQIMPADCASPESISFYLSPPKIQKSTYTSKEIMPIIRKINQEDWDLKKQIVERDGKIWDLQLKVSSLQKENMELRVFLNYFMQLKYPNL